MGHYRSGLRPIGINPDYHDGANEIRKDLSAPVLVFDKKSTWYFVDKPRALPDGLIALAATGQGHRVKLRLPGDLEVLQTWLKRIGPAGIHGRPREQSKAEDSGGCAPRRRLSGGKPKGGC